MVSVSSARLRPRVPREEPRTIGVRHLEDAKLVVRARQGDRWAREAIFRKHVEFLSALSLRLLRDRAEAEDAVQETFMEAFAHFDRLKEPGSLRAWLASIAVHRAHRRFRRRRLLSFFGLRPPPEWVGLEETLRTDVPQETRSEIACLDVILSNLREEVRAAWILRYVEGYRFDEISTACGCSLATAKRRVTHAHALIRQQMDIEESDDG